MTSLPTPSLLDAMLRAMPRRYRLPQTAALTAGPPQAGRETAPATALALAIEQGREGRANDQARDVREDRADEGADKCADKRAKAPANERAFVDALARTIREAMRPDGDPAFQAAVLRHRAPLVREYASLQAHAGDDRRQLHAAVNAIAHPGKLRRMPAGPLHDALARLHAAAAAGAWPRLRQAAADLLAMPETTGDAQRRDRLTRLSDGPELTRLQRTEALADEDAVRRYRALRDRHGPRAGSATAVAQGSLARRRGAAAEASAARPLERLARRLGEAEGDASRYRVVTSLHVPAALPGSHARAKTEWDAVLLRRADTPNTPGASVSWDICLLVEVKASVDAAATDFPRLLRGLRLLAGADAGAEYTFESGQGTVQVRGESLRTLPTVATGLARTVLYCCDAPADTAPRLLDAASRMQLLSTQESLDFAALLTEGQDPDPARLAPIWRRLLETAGWADVLNQFPLLREVRELMVHTGDLEAAVDSMPVQAL